MALKPSLGIPQSVDGFLQVGRGRAHAPHHGGLARFADEALLEHLGQAALPKRRVLLAHRRRANHLRGGGGGVSSSRGNPPPKRNTHKRTSLFRRHQRRARASKVWRAHPSPKGGSGLPSHLFQGEERGVDGDAFGLGLFGGLVVALAPLRARQVNQRKLTRHLEVCRSGL